MTRLLWLFALGVAGCAGPLVEVHPGASKGELSLAFCGSTAASGAGVLRALDGPPSEMEGRGTNDPGEITVCMTLDNHGARPVKVDRSHVTLKSPRERQPWVPDGDDEVFVIPPGTTRTFHVKFASSPLLSGEDVTIVLDSVVTTDGHSAHVPSLALRKR